MRDMHAKETLVLAFTTRTDTIETAKTIRALDHALVLWAAKCALLVIILFEPTPRPAVVPAS